MTSILIRLDPATIPPDDSTIADILGGLTALQGLIPTLSLATFTQRTNPNLYDFLIQVSGRTWTSTVTFTGPNDKDPFLTFTLPDGWHDAEILVIRNLFRSMLAARSKLGLQTFSATWVTSYPAGASTIELIPSQGMVTTGTPILLNWIAPTQFQTSPHDWISIFRVGAPNSAYGVFVYVAGQVSGSFSFPTTGLAPGQYEFRYLLNDGFTSIATSLPVTLS
jgi:hypothetical protein